MSLATTTITAGALLPIIVTLLLGYGAAWRRDFDENQAAILNRMVLEYALPMNLFAGMVSISRDQVLAQGPLALAILAGMTSAYFLVFLIVYYGARRNIMTSAMWALAIGRQFPPSAHPFSSICLARSAPFQSASAGSSSICSWYL